MTTTPATEVSVDTAEASSTTAEEKFSLPDPMPLPPTLSTLGHTMPFIQKSAIRQLVSSFRLFKQLRGRLSKNTILTARLTASISESTPRPAFPFAGPPLLSMPTLLKALRLAANDPRIAHLHLRLDPLTCGWAKIFEIRRHLEYFAASGKGITIFMEAGGPKEIFLAMGYAVYLPPEGSLGLRGFAASGAFVGGVLEKIGVEPQVERIGKYKSAGDQLARRDMSTAQREVINALLNDINEVWTKSVCEATGMTQEQLEDLVDKSPWDVQEYVNAGLITGICYESDVEDALKLKFSPRSMLSKSSDEDIIKRDMPAVDVLRYARRTSEKLLGIAGKKTIAIIRAVGAITSGTNGSSPVTGTTIGSESLVKLIRKVKNDKRFVACILRCDSPGGSALASDIIWSELRKLGKDKPLIASQSDVAASGGYYLSMASEIVSEPLSITGSVGVVTAKPSLGELYKKIGYTKENISIGSRYAELLVDDRPFTEEEAIYFREGAELAYRNFVSKAAKSRGKAYEDMEEVAQGRVWTGTQAKERGLVDHIGGLYRAIEILKEKAGLEKDEYVKLEEVRPSMSFAERLGFGGASADANLKAALKDPLALADIDGGLGGISPLTRFVLDATITPVVNQLSLLSRSPQMIDSFVRSLLDSR